jgi:hypothetical protein
MHIFSWQIGGTQKTLSTENIFGYPLKSITIGLKSLGGTNGIWIFLIKKEPS